MKRLDKHDQHRRDQLIKTLQKAFEQTETALIYLRTNDKPLEQIADTVLAQENIMVALEHLGVSVEEEATK